MERKKIVSKKADAIRVAIIGVGGIGGYFGTRLLNRFQSDRKAEIVFIQRGKHLREIQHRGLRYHTRNHHYTVYPDMATDDPGRAGLFDLVLFCVKNYQLEPAAESIKANLHRNTVVISTLNGITGGERLKELLPENRVLPGCIYLSARIETPGLVRQVGGAGRFFFGPETGDASDYRPWESFFRQALIKAGLVSDIRYRLWEKFVFVSPFATLTARYDRTIGEIMADHGHKEMLLVLVEEIRELARAESISIPEEIRKNILNRAALIPPETTTSMQLDFRRGKHTEIDIFTEYVVNQGRKRGVAVPLHEEMAAHLRKKISARD